MAQETKESAINTREGWPASGDGSTLKNRHWRGICVRWPFVLLEGSRECDKNLGLEYMSLSVARGTFNPEKGRFHFYVAFKPTVDPTADQRGVERSFPVDVALSVTETGELADLAFELPQPCKNKDSLLYLQKTDSASVIDERVFVTVPGLSGDSVFDATAKLELDGAGRIIGLEIN